VREIGSAEVGGTEYRALWAKLGLLNPAAHPGSNALALAVRDADGRTEALIRRNAKLADVEAALAHLRGLGIGDPQLSQLFAHRGKGLAQHVKVLVSRLT
jgi:hypothetical protein